MEDNVILLTKLDVPLVFLIVYIVLTTLAALFNRTEFLLIISYIFVFYLGYFCNQTLILETLKDSGFYVYLYFTFGGLIIALTLGYMLLALFKGKTPG